MKKTKKNRGFTLIEILVVIGLIAILATVVLIAINPARQFRQANDSQRSANVNAILNAVGQYLADNKGALPGGIPTGDEEAEAENIADDGADICDELVPKYLPLLPVDPDNGEALTEEDCEDSYDSGYKILNNNGRITVFADGEETADISVTR